MINLLPLVPGSISGWLNRRAHQRQDAAHERQHAADARMEAKLDEIHVTLTTTPEPLAKRFAPMVPAPGELLFNTVTGGYARVSQLRTPEQWAEWIANYPVDQEAEAAKHAAQSEPSTPLRMSDLLRADDSE